VCLFRHNSPQSARPERRFARRRTHTRAAAGRLAARLERRGAAL